MLALASCTSSSTSSGSTNTTGNAPAPTSAPSAAPGSSPASGTIKPGGTLTIALDDDLRDPSNIQLSTSQDHEVMASTVYDPLFTTGNDYSSLPALATSASHSADFKTWTFTLRTGVNYTNGKPFNAESVKANLDQFLDPKNASDLAGNLANIKSYSVVDDSHIRFVLKNADANLPATFTDNIYMAYEPYNKSDPIGTGPYSWSSRVPGDSITFARNPNYWRGTPPLDKVIFKVIPDPQVAALELEKGQIQMFPNYPTAQSLALMKKSSNVKLYSAPGLTYYQAFTDFEKDRRGKYKNGQDVRQGLADLWNAQKIVPPIVGDYGTLASQVTPPFIPGSDPSIKPWPYNPTQGKKLLAEGGIPSGGTISLIAEDRPYLCSLMTAFQSALKGLGYNATAQCLEPEVAQKSVETYSWDLAFWRQSELPLAVAELQQDWSTAIVPNPPTDVNTLRDNALQTVLNKWTGVASGTAEYTALGHQAAQIIAKQQIATLGLYYATTWVAATKNVVGIVPNGTAYYGYLMNGVTTVGFGS
jgi:peptide/nickel transport system substrate-binding protein